MNTLSTLSACEPGEIEKTEETCSVTNHEFLTVVFGSTPSDCQPIVVSLKGNPAKARSSAWSGKPWTGRNEDSAALASNANNYFSLGVFGPDAAAKIRRLKKCFHALHTIMLDDIGTKVDMERLTLEPSWLLETSPGNYQAGYILRDPITD